MSAPSKLWRPTGWTASRDGGYVIEYSLQLCGLEQAFVHRRGASWTWRVGSLSVFQEYAGSKALPKCGSVRAAKLAAEAALRAHLLEGCKLLGMSRENGRAVFRRPASKRTFSQHGRL